MKVLFESNGTDAVKLGCGSSCGNASMLVVGSSLEEKYNSYPCEDETCSGKSFRHYLFIYYLFITSVPALEIIAGDR